MLERISSVDSKSSDLSKISLSEKFSEIDERIKKIENSSMALRQAINPKNPEEILTIARLTDDLSALREKLNDLEVTLSKNLTVFQKSIIREITSANNSNTLILAVLIPLVLNFLYTVWKDFRENNNSSDRSKR